MLIAHSKVAPLPFVIYINEADFSIPYSNVPCGNKSSSSNNNNTVTSYSIGTSHVNWHSKKYWLHLCHLSFA